MAGRLKSTAKYQELMRHLNVIHTALACTLALLLTNVARTGEWRIDGIVALAIGRAMLPCEQPRSVYEDRGILIL
jgi:hypothetical protein